MSIPEINLKHHYRQFDGCFFCWPHLGAAKELPQYFCFKLPDGRKVNAVLQVVLMDFGRSGRSGADVILNTVYAEVLAAAFAANDRKTAEDNWQTELLTHISGYFSSGDDLFADFATADSSKGTLRVLLLRRIDC